MTSPELPDRWAQTRASLVEVAARLLREQGSSAVTTRGVAQAAGVQAPTIYRLFGDKDGLLEAVTEHVMATHVTAKAAAAGVALAGGVDPLEELRSGWDAQMAFGIGNPTLFLLVIDPVRGLQSPAAQAGLAVLQARVRRVAAAGRLRVSEQRAVDLVRAAGTGTVLTVLATPAGERDPGLPDATYAAVLREILTESDTVSVDTPLAAAVALRAHVSALEALSESEKQLLTEWLDRSIRDAS